MQCDLQADGRHQPGVQWPGTDPVYGAPGDPQQPSYPCVPQAGPRDLDHRTTRVGHIPGSPLQLQSPDRGSSSRDQEVQGTFGRGEVRQAQVFQQLGTPDARQMPTYQGCSVPAQEPQAQQVGQVTRVAKRIKVQAVPAVLLEDVGEGVV